MVHYCTSASLKRFLAIKTFLNSIIIPFIIAKAWYSDCSFTVSWLIATEGENDDHNLISFINDKINDVTCSV